MKKRNTLMYALVLTVVLGAVIVGYFAFKGNEANDPSRNPDTTHNGDTNVNPNETEDNVDETIKEPDEIIKDSTLTSELGKENIVEIGQIYTRGEVAYGAIVVKDTASEKEAQKVAEEYLNKIKKQYKNMKINVQVVRNGENIVNLTHGF